MANLLSFSPFSVHADEQSAGPRWRKWIDRFENLLCALDINDDRKKKAMLLHYVGEVYDIFDSFTDQQKGLGAVRETPDGNVPDEYGVAKRSLTEFFLLQRRTLPTKITNIGKLFRTLEKQLIRSSHVCAHWQVHVISMLGIGIGAAFRPRH